MRRGGPETLTDRRLPTPDSLPMGTASSEATVSGGRGWCSLTKFFTRGFTKIKVSKVIIMNNNIIYNCSACITRYSFVS